MQKHDSTDLGKRSRWNRRSSEACAHLAENPGTSLRRAPDHDAVRAALFQRLQCLGGTIDVAIDEHRHAHGLLDRGGRFVFRRARKEICARPSMHGDSGNAFVLGKARDRYGIAVFTVPARAHLERDRNTRSRDDGAQYPRDQRLIAHERGARGAIADLLGRAAEIDVDDLGAEFHVHARGIGHHGRVIARNLHDARLGLSAVIHPQTRLGRIPEVNVGRDHFRRRDPRAHSPAEPAEGQVGHARHRRESERRREFVWTDSHWLAVLIWLAQRTPPFAGRQMSSSNPTASAPGSTMRMSASARSPGSRSPELPAPGR